MDVRDIVRAHLLENGYDGLYIDWGCGCGLNDLMPCCVPCQSCKPAYFIDCKTCAKRETCAELRDLGCDYEDGWYSSARCCDYERAAGVE
jgi:hypothetical protein